MEEVVHLLIIGKGSACGENNNGIIYPLEIFEKKDYTSKCNVCNTLLKAENTESTSCTTTK